MKTVQTQPTANVGVWSRSLELPLSSLAAIATLPLYNHANKTRHKNNLCLYFDITIVETNKKKHNHRKMWKNWKFKNLKNGCLEGKWWYGFVENEIKIATLCHTLIWVGFENWKLKIENGIFRSRVNLFVLIDEVMILGREKKVYGSDYDYGRVVAGL